jgi:hypothetical protein
MLKLISNSVTFIGIFISEICGKYFFIEQQGKYYFLGNCSLPALVNCIRKH